MPAKPAQPTKMGRPPTGAKKINASFYPPEVVALKKLAVEQNTPLAKLVAELAVQQLVDEGRLAIDEDGNVNLPAGER